MVSRRKLTLNSGSIPGQSPDCRPDVERTSRVQNRAAGRKEWYSASAAWNTPGGTRSIICDGAKGAPGCQWSTIQPFRLNALWTALLVLLALGHDGRTQARAEVVRQFVQLGVAIDLDRLLGGRATDIAVVAPGEMILQLDLCVLVEDAVQIVGQLVQKLRAFHCSPSPLSRFWKNLPRRSRSCNRARSSRDFTAGTLNSSAAAVSSVESPSTSLSTNTVRKPGGRPWIVLLKISRNSACVYCCSGLGLQSAISRGRESSSVFMSSSSETVRSGFLRRNFINASLTAMRTSQV